MALGFGMLFGFAFVIWIVFFKFKWLTFSIPWAIFSSLAVIHLLFIFLIGMRFVELPCLGEQLVLGEVLLVHRD